MIPMLFLVVSFYFYFWSGGMPQGLLCTGGDVVNKSLLCLRHAKIWVEQHLQKRELVSTLKRVRGGLLINSGSPDFLDSKDFLGIVLRAQIQHTRGRTNACCDTYIGKCYGLTWYHLLVIFPLTWCEGFEWLICICLAWKRNWKSKLYTSYFKLWHGFRT